MSNRPITIGADIGGGHILSAAVDTEKKQIIDSSRSYIKVDNKGSVDEIMKTWSSSLNATISSVSGDHIAGIAFAMPGPFNYRTGQALFKGNDKYEALYGIDITTTLATYITTPHLKFRFLNDATSFAVGEAWFGKASKHTKVIALTLGTGLGSAFIESGKPIVSREDVPMHGSLWHLPFKEGIADDYFSTRWFVNEYKRITGIQVSGVKDIADLADSTESAKQTFSTFGTDLGAFLTPWLQKFEPDMLVIGGNIAKSLHRFRPSLQHVLTEGSIKTVITDSQLMEDAALIGSTKLFDEAFWQQVKNELPEK